MSIQHREDSIRDMKLERLGVTPPQDWNDVEQVRTAKKAEIGLACSAAIYAGIDVGGAHYSLTEHDQTELMAQFQTVKEGAKEVPYHADGELCRIKRGETKILKQILFNLVTQAEKQFGSGTGSLKYAAVADWIYQRIPAVLKLLFTSSDIEKMIEAALEEAKKAWGANENLKGYIDTPSVESLLVGIEGQAVQTEPAEN